MNDHLQSSSQFTSSVHWIGGWMAFRAGTHIVVVKRCCLSSLLLILWKWSLSFINGSTDLCWALADFSQSVVLLGQGISPSKGRYLHTGHLKRRINANRHPFPEWDSNPRHQCSSGRRHFMPYITRPLWSAQTWIPKYKCSSFRQRLTNIGLWSWFRQWKLSMSGEQRWQHVCKCASV
jgi:hypothetical protein